MWKLSLLCFFLAARWMAWILTWLLARDTERLEVLNFIFACILHWGGKHSIFIHYFCHSASFFPLLERTGIFLCSPSMQVAAGHFRPRVQTCRRLCSDQLNKCTPPTESAPLKARMNPLTVQCFRLCGFCNICKARTVKASFWSFWK